jgi:hypothetical protein
VSLVEWLTAVVVAEAWLTAVVVAEEAWFVAGSLDVVGGRGNAGTGDRVLGHTRPPVVHLHANAHHARRGSPLADVLGLWPY